MKKLVLMLVVLSLFAPESVYAGCGCGYRAVPVPGPGGVAYRHGAGPYRSGPIVGYGPNGRPYYYNGVGRYPKAVFATPLRPWGGITPVRQFLFGRGRIRRQNRRAFLFG